MPKQFFVKRGGQVMGPVSSSRVKQGVEAGKILRSDELSNSAEGPWKAMDDVPGLAKLFKESKPVEPDEILHPEEEYEDQYDDYDYGEDDSYEEDEPVMNPPLVVHDTPVQRRGGRAPARTGGGQPVASAAVQVNVSQSRMSHSLGIASLVIGILAFFVFWIPFIGLFFAGIGFLLGAVGCIAAIVRKGSGVGYSIAGTAVSLVAVVLGGVWTLAVTGTAVAVSELPDAVAEAREQARAKQAERAANSNAEEGAADSRVTDTGTGDESGASGVTTDAEITAVEESPWKDASETQEVGNIRISITSVVTGTVPLKTSISDREGESENELLTIWLRIENISERRKVDYSGWMSDHASLRSIDATLTDDVDNRYRPIRFSAMTSVSGATPRESIYPGKAIDDAVVFELPVEGTEFLRLSLTGNAFDEEAEIQFQIPASMIQNR